MICTQWDTERAVVDKSSPSGNVMLLCTPHGDSMRIQRQMRSTGKQHSDLELHYHHCAGTIGRIRNVPRIDVWEQTGAGCAELRWRGGTEGCESCTRV